MWKPKNKAHWKPQAACVHCLYACGFGCRKIAERLGYSFGASVARLLRRRGIAARGASERNRIAAWRKHERKRANKLFEATWADEWRGCVESYYEQRHETAAERFKRKYHENVEFNLKHKLRRRLRQFVKGKKSYSTRQAVGCSFEQLKQHIESQFDRGMRWDNMGDWHIDHIIPCDAFDLTDKQQLMVCFNWQNLRPMWALANIKKSNTITKPQMPLPLNIDCMGPGMR